mmetsp:Transcript_9559/g.12511  ORF Transcript_9559/g.12511 Transcript_9559/m.12511 type:complete len:354 (-) Transcript_9559:211-1272(-)
MGALVSIPVATARVSQTIVAVFSRKRSERWSPDHLIIPDHLNLSHQQNAELNLYGVAQGVPFPASALETPGEGFTQRATLEKQPTATVHALVNIKKASFALLGGPDVFYLDFQFDALQACSITMYILAEESNSGYLVHPPGCEIGPFETGPGSNISLHQALLADNQVPPKFSQDRLKLVVHQTSLVQSPTIRSKVLPFLVEIRTISTSSQVSTPRQDPTDEDFTISKQTSYVKIESYAEGMFSISCTDQKCQFDNSEWIIQDVFGLSKGMNESECSSQCSDEGKFSNDPDCVVCMSAEKNVMVLPCSHVCLCEECAKQLPLRSKNCPICREAFTDVMKIKNTSGHSKVWPSSS